MNAPWKWSEDGTQIIDAKGLSVLKIRPSDASEEEFAAIVAAPDLLEACRAALKIMHSYIPPDAFDGHAAQALVLVKDAIQKAEGRS